MITTMPFSIGVISKIITLSTCLDSPVPSAQMPVSRINKIHVLRKTRHLVTGTVGIDRGTLIGSRINNCQRLSQSVEFQIRISITGTNFEPGGEGIVTKKFKTVLTGFARIGIQCLQVLHKRNDFITDIGMIASEIKRPVTSASLEPGFIIEMTGGLQRTSKFNRILDFTICRNLVGMCN